MAIKKQRDILSLNKKQPTRFNPFEPGKNFLAAQSADEDRKATALFCEAKAGKKEKFPFLN